MLRETYGLVTMGQTGPDDDEASDVGERSRGRQGNGSCRVSTAIGVSDAVMPRGCIKGRRCGDRIDSIIPGPAKASGRMPHPLDDRAPLLK